MPFDSLGDFIKAADAVGECNTSNTPTWARRRRTHRIDRRTQRPDARLRSVRRLSGRAPSLR